MKINENIKARFESLKTSKELADLIGLDIDHINACLEEKTVEGYRSIKIYQRKKLNQPDSKGKFREISIPNNNLMLIQKKLLKVLEAVYKPKTCVYGFVKGRGIAQNAQNHVNCRVILNIDIENFFPSITSNRVRGLFITYGTSAEVADLLVKICCFDEKSQRSGIPQGAPTSPVISNMILGSFDSEMTSLISGTNKSSRSKKNFCYTRYADDITISSKKLEFPEILVHLDEKGRVILGKSIKKIFKKYGFKINNDKTSLQKSGERQEVTGLIVNSKVNIKNEKNKEIRKMIHMWEEFGIEKTSFWLFPGLSDQESRIRSFINRLAGNIRFMKSIKSPRDRCLVRYIYRIRQESIKSDNILVKGLASEFSIEKSYNEIANQNDLRNEIFLFLVLRCVKIDFGIHSSEYGDFLLFFHRFIEQANFFWKKEYEKIRQSEFEKESKDQRNEDLDILNDKKMEIILEVRKYIKTRLNSKLDELNEIFNWYSRSIMDYELGLKKIEELLNETEFESEYLGYKGRLLENLREDGLYGTNETIISSRNRIVAQLNKFCISNNIPNFTSLCLPSTHQLGKKGVLFIASRPDSLNTLRTDREANCIREEWNTSKKRNKFNFVDHQAVKSTSLFKVIMSENPRIIHFSTHGDADDGIIFEDDNGDTHTALSSELEEVFRYSTDNLECIFLNLCYSESQVESLKKVSKYVIGVKGEILDDDAIDFSKMFYQMYFLTEDVKKSYDLAISQAKFLGKNLDGCFVIH
jgi:RNA-directed DNA polymerase